MSSIRIPLAGVIGTPVAHSKSPRVHGHWLRRYGVPGYYIPMDVASDDLESAIATLPKLGFVGVNVTIPHKEHILTLADIVSDRAALMGAANTILFRSDGKVHADNTDGYGFIENLRQGVPDWDPKAGPAAVIGAGGATTGGGVGDGVATGAGAGTATFGTAFDAQAARVKVRAMAPAA